MTIDEGASRRISESLMEKCGAKKKHVDETGTETWCMEGKNSGGRRRDLSVQDE